MKTKKEQLQKKKKPNNGTSQLIGVKSFSRNGLLTDGHGELSFYLVRPTNISVLSQMSIAVKVRHLMQLLTAQPDIEVCCLDDQECFDDNKAYLEKRIDEETNPKIRALLDKDMKFLDSIQLQMSTAQQFMFIVRLRSNSEEQSFVNLNRIEKVLSEQGFDARKASKSDIKRILTIYFGGKMMSEKFPIRMANSLHKNGLFPTKER